MWTEFPVAPVAIALATGAGTLLEASRDRRQAVSAGITALFTRMLTNYTVSKARP